MNILVNLHFLLFKNGFIISQNGLCACFPSSDDEYDEIDEKKFTP